VEKAIREEFLEKGFEKASIRSIGVRAGMTSAGLYRHYPDKESMFNSVVEPLIARIREWTKRHTDKKYELVGKNTDREVLFGETFLDLVHDVILPEQDAFRLLMTSSAGTKYENFIHEYVRENQVEFRNAIMRMGQLGYPVADIDDEGLHTLMSAYLTACFEPIIHCDDRERIERQLQIVREFFLPGWMKIMGVR